MKQSSKWWELFAQQLVIHADCLKCKACPWTREQVITNTAAPDPLFLPYRILNGWGSWSWTKFTSFRDSGTNRYTNLQYCNTILSPHTRTVKSLQWLHTKFTACLLKSNTKQSVIANVRLSTLIVLNLSQGAGNRIQFQRITIFYSTKALRLVAVTGFEPALRTPWMFRQLPFGLHGYEKWWIQWDSNSHYTAPQAVDSANWSMDPLRRRDSFSPFLRPLRGSWICTKNDFCVF